MLKTANLGFPRIGANRELKKAVESYWKKTSSLAELQKEASAIKAKNWQTQKAAGINFIPSNDFSFYDQTLDTLAQFLSVSTLLAEMLILTFISQWLAEHNATEST
jgi:5-methyltetrahydropteroyltriglutamate--homocysteine methyltransferase